MRILILTIGTRGDIEPYVALGKGLKTRGHDVMICTSGRFKPEIEAHALQYGHMNSDLLELLDSDEGKAMFEGVASPMSAVRTMAKTARKMGPIQSRMIADSWATTNAFHPDVILYHHKMCFAPHFGEKLGVPVVMAPLMPMHVPTGEFPCFGFPSLPLMPKTYNRATYRFVHRAMGAMIGKHVRAWRSEEGLPDRGATFTHDSAGNVIPVIHGYSRHVLPVAQDWPANVIASGNWTLPTAGDWQPSDELCDFLDAGEPPIYIGFGSMGGRNTDRLTRAILEGTGVTRVRCILAMGWGGMGKVESGPDVLQIEQAPHDWLLPRVSAVVHHGGAGTTAAGLRAGRPTIICPFGGDQWFWGRRVRDLGAGPAPIAQKRLDGDRFAAVIRDVIGNGAMLSRAEQIGAALRAENGVMRAVGQIEALVEPPSSRLVA